ncbi:MAG: efflux RND transporter permease subunit, partial [Pseudomonadota bacterium]|nr:efflux RND transporter permease subunit [Pseudomonadota bacterium]
MSRWLAGHARSLLFAFVLLTLAGIGAATRLPVALFPQISFPRVVVAIDAGERAASQTETQVTRPLERALRSVPGVTDIRSTTSRGSADISLTFGWGRDMTTAALQAQAAVNAILPDLPAGVRFDVRRMDPTVFPVLGLALSAPNRDPVSLRNFADLELRPLIAAVPGVAAVDILGGGQAEYQVKIDPARLQAMNLAMDDVNKALAAANVLSATGRLEDRHRLYLTLVD